eukprot:g5955.t1
MKETEEKRENVAKISKLLGTNVRATILDGRMFTGIFKIVDKNANMVLEKSTEYKNDEKRYAGTIMIPGKHLVKFEAQIMEKSDTTTSS